MPVPLTLPARWKFPLLRLLVRLRPWRAVMPIGSFAAGLAGFFLVERQPSAASWLALVLIASWVWLLAESVLARVLHARASFRLPLGAVRFATQFVHQETLFFSLPFFLVTTTWRSGQALFTALLIAAAAISIVDPLYFGWLVRRRWLYLAYHAFCLFAMTLVTLPLVLELTTGESYRLATAAMVVFSLPSLAEALQLRQTRRWLRFAAAVACLGLAAWLVRPWVPPATLWLTEVALSTRFDEAQRQPAGGPLRLTENVLRGPGLYAYTAIRAPRGLHERIYHVWYHEGEVVDRIALEVTGGRERGYRSWSHKEAFPADSVGQWRVEVVTGAGQLIGVLRFEIAPPGAPADVIPARPHDPRALPIEPPA